MVCVVPKAPPPLFTTSFPATENPIAQGGIWQRGLSDGADWTDPKTIAGKCVASVAPTPSRYSDDIAHLKASAVAFNANQWAEGTVFLQSGYTGNGGSHEIELLVRFDISASDAHGYEVLWGMNPSGNYLAIVKWNGAVGSYTPIVDPGIGSISAPVDGDVLRAEISGTSPPRLTVFLNGSPLSNFTNVDLSVGSTISTWSAGQPGVGFWPVDGAIVGDYGWRTFRAGNL